MIRSPCMWTCAGVQSGPKCKMQSPKTSDFIMLIIFCLQKSNSNSQDRYNFYFIWPREGTPGGIIFNTCTLLRSAVGKTHDLRSDLWWTIPLHVLLGHFWDTLWIPTNQVSLSQTLRCPGACDSRLPYPTYGSTWVVLWLLICRSAPSTFPVAWSTFKGPFRRVPSR